jgi:hypothetical protein
MFSGFLQAQSEIFDSLTVELNQYKLTHSKDSEDKRVLNLLDNLYEEILQTNKGLSQETLNEYREINKSDSVLNKSIFFLFKKYQDYITETVAQGKPANWDFQLAMMKLLSDECYEIYDSIPAIVLIYMGEALMSAGMNEKAIEHFEMSKEFYPDSIPIKVYLVLLDEVGNKKIKKELLRKSGDHWMVKEKLNPK